MDPILVLRHSDYVPAGYLDEVLTESRAVRRNVNLVAGEPVPGAEGWSAIIALGGPMGAYEAEEYPFLVEEKALLRAAVEANVPVLGICLGCQMLADCLGGKAYLAETPEASFAPIEVLPAARDEPLVAALDGPVLSIHRDAWDPPPGATLLARSTAYPQAFRCGSALGIQPHPEATPEIVAYWLTNTGAVDIARGAGTKPEDILEAMEKGRVASAAQAHRAFSAWLNGVG